MKEVQFRFPGLAKWAGLVAGFWLQHAADVSAVIANREPFEFAQPDGSKVTLRLRGDEFFHCHEDLNGFTVLRNNGWFVYAQLDAQNRLAPTEWRVGQVDPATRQLKAHLLPPRNIRPGNLNTALPPHHPWKSSTSVKNDGRMAAKGTVKNLVILCRFSDHTSATHTRAQADYDVMFNRVGGDPTLAPTGSVRDAYEENSYGLVMLESTVLAWVTLPQTQEYYAGTDNGMGSHPNNSQKMVQDALDLVDPTVDFAQFDRDADGYIDAIDVIHSGYGAENANAPANSIWSHRWTLPEDWVSADSNSQGARVKVRAYHTEPALWGSSGTAITRIGVICHETGHFFGLPDLYDTDTDSGTTSEGIGSYCMMANSWGFDNTELHPPHFSAWCKIQLGWVTPVVIGPGIYSVPQVESSSTVFRIDDGFPSSEYLLIENREPVGLESDMPQGGLCIWHIDDAQPDNTREGFPGQAGWPANNHHYKVALLQAEGNYDLEHDRNRGDAGDVYHAGGNDAIGSNTVPSTHRYQGGIESLTGIEISHISAASPSMTFCYVNGPTFFVEGTYIGTTQRGTCDLPFSTIRAAHDAAVGGETMLVRGGYYAEAVLQLYKQVTIRSLAGPVTIGP